jgi:hypothetical protein
MGALDVSQARIATCGQKPTADEQQNNERRGSLAPQSKRHVMILLLIRVVRPYPTGDHSTRGGRPFTLSGLLVHFLQNIEQGFIVRQLVDVVHVRVADDAILVHDKRRPFGVALRT